MSQKRAKPVFVKRSLSDISDMSLCPACQKSLLDTLAAAGVTVDYDRGRWQYPAFREAQALAAFFRWKAERSHNH